MKRFAPVGWGALAFIIGMVPVFGLAGRALFAGGDAAARFGEVVFAGVGLFVVAIGGGAIVPPHRLAVAIGLALPVLPALLVASWAEPWAVVLAALLTVETAAAVWAGTAIGVNLTGAVEARRARRG